MPQAKFTKQFDYQRKLGERLTSYPKGYEGDVPQAHYDAAAEAGAIDSPAKPAETASKAASTGGASTK